MSSPRGYRESSPFPGDKDRRSKFTFRQLSQLATYGVGTPLRVIAHVDLDAFYAQCEMVRLGVPEDQPLAVQQWQGVIAVNYPARKHNIGRHCTVTEAKKLCPELIAQHVATWREGFANWAYREDAAANIQTDKVSLDPYRLESRKILAVIRKSLPPQQQKIEKAGIDEVFLDLSAHVHEIIVARFPEAAHPGGSGERMSMPSVAALDWGEDKLVALEDDEETMDPDWDDVVLNIGSEIVREVRKAVRSELGYTCSAGIAHNKMIAKLGSAHNKPNKQTVIRNRTAGIFLEGLKFTKIRMLGGKLGDQVASEFGTEEVKELLSVPIEQLKARLGDDTGSWVYNTVRGIDHSQVSSRTQIKSMLSAKSFRPSISNMEQAHRWLRIFAADIYARLVDEGVQENKRRPKTINLSHRHASGQTRSRQAPIPGGKALEEGTLLDQGKTLLAQMVGEGNFWPCANLSLSVGGFEEGVTGNMGIGGFLVRGEKAQALRVEKERDKDTGRAVAPIMEGASRKRRAEEPGIERFLARKLDDSQTRANAASTLPFLPFLSSTEAQETHDVPRQKTYQDKKSGAGGLFARKLADDSDDMPNQNGNRGSQASGGIHVDDKTDRDRDMPYEDAYADGKHGIERFFTRKPGRDDTVSPTDEVDDELGKGGSREMPLVPLGNSITGIRISPQRTVREWPALERADPTSPEMEGLRREAFDGQGHRRCPTTSTFDFGQVSPVTAYDEAVSRPHTCAECNMAFKDAEALQGHSDWHLAWRLNEEELEQEQERERERKGEMESERGRRVFAGRGGGVPRSGARGGSAQAASQASSTSSGRRGGKGGKLEPGQTKLKFG